MEGRQNQEDEDEDEENSDHTYQINRVTEK